MKLNKICNWLLLGTLSVLLSACGTDERESSEGGNQSQTQQVTLSADNAIDSIVSGLASYISLENKIHATSSVGDNTVSEVVSLSDQSACRDIDVYSSGYSVDSTGYIGTCVYEYTVENTVDLTAHAVAYSTAVVQQSATGSVDQFEPIAEVAEASQSLDINLADKLAGQIPAGYTLSETITNLGVGSATLDIMNETITFISDEPGYSQIIYSYASETKVKVGSINIAVSSELNSAPVAPNINYSADINNKKVNINTEVTIDVGSYISDPDGEPLQLVYVDSWYASVTPLDLSDESNTAFTFNTDRAGEHFVTYAISDHNGGYDIGQVRIEVYDPGSAASWGDIQQGLNVFYGPLTHTEAFGQGVIDSGTNFDLNKNVATFNYADATNSCESKGGLPSEAQLKKLYNTSRPQSQGWPVALNYWSNDVNTVVSLSNGQSSMPVGSDTYYVTCVNEGGFVIDNKESFTSDIIANGGSTNEGIATVVVELTFNGQPISGEPITADIPSSTEAELSASTVTTDEYGISVFTITDIKAETVSFTAGYNGEERKIDITFIGDKSSAELLSQTIVNNAAISNGINEIIATLKDSNDNPIKGESINFYSEDSNVSVIAQSNITDENGQQKAQILWIGSTELSSDPTVTIRSEYTRVDNVELFSESLISFSIAKLVSIHVESDYSRQPAVVALLATPDGTPVAEGTEVEFKSSTPYCGVGNNMYGGVFIAKTDSEGKARAFIYHPDKGADDLCVVTASYQNTQREISVHVSEYVQLQGYNNCAEAGYVEAVASDFLSWMTLKFIHYPDVPNGWGFQVGHDNYGNYYRLGGIQNNKRQILSRGSDWANYQLATNAGYLICSGLKMTVN